MSGTIQKGMKELFEEIVKNVEGSPYAEDPSEAAMFYDRCAKQAGSYISEATDIKGPSVAVYSGVKAAFERLGAEAAKGATVVLPTLGTAQRLMAQDPPKPRVFSL